MKDHIINLDKPRKLKYGFKAHKIIREKYGEKKSLADILNVHADEIPFFAWAGLVWEDKSLTYEKVEELSRPQFPISTQCWMSWVSSLELSVSTWE